MALNTNDPRINEFSDREISWIFNELWRQGPDTIEQKRARIKKYINESRINYNQVITIQSQLLPDEELRWIKRTDIRLLRWIVHYCSDLLFNSSIRIQIQIPRFSPIPESNLYDYFVNALDNCQIEIQSKRRSLNQINLIWNELLLKDKKLKWLSKSNKKQMEWGWDYLNTNTNKYKLNSLYKYSSININTNAEEIYLAILSIFDTWEGDTGDMYLLQTNMKQAWAQQKYRTNLNAKNKKQSTYVLSEKTKKNLEELAVARNVRLNQMLENIINEAHKKFKTEKT